MHAGATAERGRPQRPSRALLAFFERYLRFFFRRHFHALRFAGAAHWQHSGRPLVVCLNHPSWWDPLTSILLSRTLDPAADHYAPMDAAAFGRYGILRRLGLFPVEQGTTRGAAQFLRGAAAVLADARAVLWITPQGSFTDVRSRPLALRPGLDTLLRRYPEITVLPLALEYVFWDERLPEALALLGEPVVLHDGLTPRGERGGDAVASALAAAQDVLSGMATRRDPSLFPVTVVAGSAGTSGIYGAWQRLRARLQGRRFHPEHASLARAGKTEATLDRG